jgi:SAM-dependent methyltransferase
MKYHPFTPEPEAVSARILAYQPQMEFEGTAPATSMDLPTTLAGLIALRDREFVEGAYRVILGRKPGPESLEEHLRQLREGRLSKIDIVGDLRYSPEGQTRAAPLAGLGRRYALRRIGRLPYIGWVYRWAMAVARLPLLLQVARSQHARTEQSELREELVQRRVDRLQDAYDDTRAELAATNQELREVSAMLSARIEAQMVRLVATERAFETRHERLTAANARLTQLLVDRPAAVEPVTPARQNVPAVPQSVASAPEPARSTVPGGFDTFYLEFEDHFRGSRERTKEWQEVYLDYVATAKAGNPSSPIVDVGCGRGEWLELLREHGCVARGVDLNRAMLAANRHRGLDVVESDVLGYLRSLADQSVGMVTGFHIIEHLGFDVVVAVLDECRRVLQPGGCVIFETPNPENLVVGAYTFYFDPTHRNPLPPQMTQFLVEQRGFADVEILRLHPRAEEGADQALLDKWFRSATDYAVIGWKDGRAAD